MIDAARRKGKTFVELKRLLEIELLLGNGPRTQSCKSIGIDKEEEEVFLNTCFRVLSSCILSTCPNHLPFSDF